MDSSSIYDAIIAIDRPVFKTREIASLTGRSLSSVSTSLKQWSDKGSIENLYRGVWANTKDPKFNLYAVAPFLLEGHLTYVSFLSALHMYGIISQIPKVIYCATTAHTKTVKTKLASYSFHKISGSFFKGFAWDKNSSFLLATAEKAFVDTLYISSRKGKKFYHFPELEFPSSFSFKKAKKWTELIKEKRIKSFILERLDALNPKRAR